jgi:hypothetical protein
MEVHDVKYPDADKCRAEVYVRDTYRLHRGKGFKLHYTARQCRRKPFKEGYCAQHYGMKAEHEDRIERLSLQPDHWARAK